ncbi:MAG: hypothetical protein JNL01_11205 [Bdellovibrionales bacterium]|nr:hypothetical protein [Bdellovibrionales bacterium]
MRGFLFSVAAGLCFCAQASAPVPATVHHTVSGEGALQETRVIYEPSALEFTDIVLLLHGCNPWTGWSKLDLSLFKNPRARTLYLMPMSPASMLCVQGTLAHFTQFTVPQFVASVVGKLPSTVPTIARNPVFRVAAHSGGMKVVPRIEAMNPGLIQEYTLVDATYLNGLMTTPPTIEAEFRAFAVQRQSQIQCLYSTLPSALPKAQTTAQGCLEVCYGTKMPMPQHSSCALYSGQAVDHMGLFYESFGKYF